MWRYERTQPTLVSGKIRQAECGCQVSNNWQGLAAIHRRLLPFLKSFAGSCATIFKIFRG